MPVKSLQLPSTGRASLARMQMQTFHCNCPLTRCQEDSAINFNSSSSQQHRCWGPRDRLLDLLAQQCVAELLKCLWLRLWLTSATDGKHTQTIEKVLDKSSSSQHWQCWSSLFQSGVCSCDYRRRVAVCIWLDPSVCSFHQEQNLSGKLLAATGELNLTLLWSRTLSIDVQCRVLGAVCCVPGCGCKQFFNYTRRLNAFCCRVCTFLISSTSTRTSSEWFWPKE